MTLYGLALLPYPAGSVSRLPFPAFFVVLELFVAPSFCFPTVPSHLSIIPHPHLFKVPATLCPYLCRDSERSREFFGENPRDPERTCEPYVNKERCMQLPRKELQRYAEEDCQRIASLFTLGVTMFGGEAFHNAQRSHCTCKVPSRADKGEL